MDNSIISINGLDKGFKVSIRENTGLYSSFKSIFKKNYKCVEALKNIDLDIKYGEIRGLIGPNGAGKSTLIKIMSGVLHPTNGEVSVMGFTPWLDREKYVKNIGVLLGQRTQLWWDLPPIDTFALNKKLYNIPDKVYNENLDYFIKLLRIEEVVTKPVRQLSLGERMKCEILCALLHDPKLVFLDEPTIGLDIVSKEYFHRFIKDVNREKGTTFIITTHDISDIENLCHRICIINKGEKVFDDSLEKLKCFYDNKRIIKVMFSKKVDSSKLNDFQIKNLKAMGMEIELDLERKKLKEEIYRILESLPIHDISIGSIGIEEVIKEIYAK